MPRCIEDRRNKRGIDKRAGAVVDQDDVGIVCRLDSCQGRGRARVATGDDPKHAVDPSEGRTVSPADLVGGQHNDHPADPGTGRHRANGS
jgi:hypothetical protein